MADRIARSHPGATVVINDPDRHWNARQRASRPYPVIDTCYHFDELLELAAGLVEPQKLPV